MAEDESKRKLEKASKDARTLAEKVASESLREAMSKLGAKLKESYEKTISDEPDET
jgi:hypothetical protein